MRLLLVEDDDQIAQFVQQGLEEAGYVVGPDVERRRRLSDGTERELRRGGDRPDAAETGRSGLIQSWRQRGGDTPVLILSAKRSVDERVEGLKAGGDDYLTKPFAIAELLARAQALVRRNTGTAESQ